MARAAEIVSLRALGLSLTAVGRALEGDAEERESVLALHQAALENRMRQLADSVEAVRTLRAAVKPGRAPSARELARETEAAVASFDLPWPWGGERFELRHVRRLNYLIGPLFSGKTQLARAIAAHLPHARFIGLERLDDGGAEAEARLDADEALRSRVRRMVARIVEHGASASPALTALAVALEGAESIHVVVDMIEQGLDRASQEALIAYLRRRGSTKRTMFLLTRSSAILDLTAVGPDESIILCPANHDPPTRVLPYRGAPGYEAVATCLATPEVRARTEGVVAVRRHVA
jgi:hypothetical protein